MNSSTSKSFSYVVINYLLLLGAGFIWGSQYILNKAALESFPTSMIAAGRISIGLMTLTLILLTRPEQKNRHQQRHAFWKSLPAFILIGLLEATIPCILVAWAQKQLPSSITAILIGTFPLLTILLEALFIKETRLSTKKILGMFLGFLGVILIAVPKLLTLELCSAATCTSLPLLPVLAVLGASCCFALAILLIKVCISTNFGPIRTAQGILLGASITSLPLMICLTKPWEMTSFHPLASSLWSILLLGIFCGGIVYILYVQLIHRAGPSFASMCSYLVPPIGAFIGITFSGEKMTPNILASLLLILMALWLSSTTQRKDCRLKTKAEG